MKRTNYRVNWIGSIGTLLILLLLLAGCGDVNKKENTSSANKASLEEIENIENSSSNNNSFSNSSVLTVSDSTGAQLQLPANVERVACLTEICVDSLAELGLEPVAIVPSSIAYEPEYYGERASSFVQIGGGFMEPSLEDISKSNPDVVIGLKGTHDLLRDGLQSIAPLYIADLKTYDDSIAFLEMIGQWTGKEEAAATAKQNFLDKLNHYKNISPNNQSALILYGSDINFGIDTEGSLVGSLLSELTPYPWPAPTEDEGHQAGGMAYSLEKVLETNPDYIFVETFKFSPDAPPLSDQFAANPIWGRLNAVKENQIVEVRTPIWANGRGTRSLSIVMDEAMNVLYPDVIEESVQ